MPLMIALSSLWRGVNGSSMIAERETVALARDEAVRPEAIRYLNRLSDLLFVLARVLARADGQGEVLWNHDRRHA